MPENIRLNCTHYLILKNPNKRERKRIASQNSSDVDFQDFINHYKQSTAKPYSSLVIDNNLASDNPSRFRKNFIERI